MSKTSINDFTGLTQIGHGAFGTVYKALYKTTKRTFALKRMKKSHLQKQNMISQINTQISISTNLKHQNIIKVYDCFEDEEYIYLVLELAENGQLYQKLRKVGRFDQMTVKNMVKEVVAAVEYLHLRNPPIVHRDIKPQNLLLDKNNKIKLADFGWSTVLNKPRKTYCGTVDYLAPEMIDKSGHDQKLDIWCIGVLVYELLTGRTPFLGGQGSAKNPQAVYENILNVRIEFPEDFPTLAKDFVLGMVKRNPKQRMNFPQIKNHPWLRQSNEAQIKLQKQPQASQRVNTGQKTQKIQKAQYDSGSSKIIKQLNKRIRQLQQQNLTYKQKLQQAESRSKQNGHTQNSDLNETTRLMNQVRRLKVAQQMNQKYKKNQQKMWEQINSKQKQLIKIKSELKRVQDYKAQIQRLEGDKQKLQQKLKRLQKQFQTSQQKNKTLQSKLDEVNSGFAQRVKNGQKLGRQQIQTPQFMMFLRDQISELTQKFQQSKDIVSKMLLKQKKQADYAEQYAKLKAQEKKMRDIVRAELREQFQNQKDDLLMKVRNQLCEQRQKWFKERDQLKSIYQQGNGTSTETQSTKNSRQQDLQAELKNVRELNSYYQKTLNTQRHQIQDLKQQLKRKK